MVLPGNSTEVIILRWFWLRTISCCNSGAKTVCMREITPVYNRYRRPVHVGIMYLKTRARTTGNRGEGITYGWIVSWLPERVRDRALLLCVTKNSFVPFIASTALGLASSHRLSHDIGVNKIVLCFGREFWAQCNALWSRSWLGDVEVWVVRFTWPLSPAGGPNLLGTSGHWARECPFLLPTQ